MFYCIFSMSSHQTNKESPDLQSVVTSAFLSTLITITLHAGKLARVIIRVSHSNPLVVSVLPSLKSS